jgi:hypothetical protein
MANALACSLYSPNRLQIPMFNTKEERFPKYDDSFCSLGLTHNIAQYHRHAYHFYYHALIIVNYFTCLDDNINTLAFRPFNLWQCQYCIECIAEYWNMEAANM